MGESDQRDKEAAEQNGHQESTPLKPAVIADLPRSYDEQADDQDRENYCRKHLT